METFQDSLRIVGTNARGLHTDEVHFRLWFKLCKGVWFVGITEIRDNFNGKGKC